MNISYRIVFGYCLLIVIFGMGAWMASTDAIEPTVYFFASLGLVGLSGFCSALLAGIFGLVRACIECSRLPRSRRILQCSRRRLRAAKASEVQFPHYLNFSLYYIHIHLPLYLLKLFKSTTRLEGSKSMVRLHIFSSVWLFASLD